jgi:AcrR family transcriptional regulator
MRTNNVIPLQRKISRDQRRQQLIDATIRVLARRGFAQTTMTDVANEAGVSHGLVNFHFQSKDNLLSETLLFMAEEYRKSWTQALAAAGNSPAEKLKAMLLADYEEDISSSDQQECGANDLAYIKQLEDICADLIREGDYGHDVVRTARVLRLTSEGLWLDILSMISSYSRKEAAQTLLACAAVHFPKHFGANGEIL